MAQTPLPGTAADVTTTFTYTPASQIASLTRSNDSYAWRGAVTVDRPHTINGRNPLHNLLSKTPTCLVPLHR